MEQTILMHPRRRAMQVAIAAATTLILVAPLAPAQEEEIEPATIVAGRQANLRDLGAAFKGLTDELKKSSPVLPLLKQHARQIDDLSQQQKFWYPVGSGPQPGVDTKAKAAIWTQPAPFNEARKHFEVEAGKLLKTVDAGDLAAVRLQQKAVGKTCEGCHRQFREKED